MLQTQFKHNKLGPFDKNCNFGHIWLLAILQKGSTSPMHNFLNFDSLKVFLDFLESLRCPLSNHVFLISIWYSMFLYEALTKKVFCWLFKMTYNVQIHNFLWVHIFNLGDEDGLYRIASSSKWDLDGSFIIKYEKVMLGQSWVDFSYKTLI